MSHQDVLYDMYDVCVYRHDYLSIIYLHTCFCVVHDVGVSIQLLYWAGVLLNHALFVPFYFLFKYDALLNFLRIKTNIIMMIN